MKLHPPPPAHARGWHFTLGADGKRSGAKQEAHPCSMSSYAADTHCLPIGARAGIWRRVPMSRILCCTSYLSSLKPNAYSSARSPASAALVAAVNQACDAACCCQRRAVLHSGRLKRRLPFRSGHGGVADGRSGAEGGSVAERSAAMRGTEEPHWVLDLLLCFALDFGPHVG
jgi:hypothetical protein